MTSDYLFTNTSEGLIEMEESDYNEDYPLLEYTAPLEEQALPIVSARQSIVLHFGLVEEGFGRSRIA